MTRILFPVLLLGLALYLSQPQLRSLVNVIKYARIRWDYLRRLKWRADAWGALILSARSDTGKAYAMANYCNTRFEIEYIKTNTSWWEEDYETLFDKKRV